MGNPKFKIGDYVTADPENNSEAKGFLGEVLDTYYKKDGRDFQVKVITLGEKEAADVKKRWVGRKMKLDSNFFIKTEEPIIDKAFRKLKKEIEGEL